MPQDSGRVIVPGHGRYWQGNTDTPPPGQVLQITGNPTSATFTLTVGGSTSSNIVINSTDTLQTRLNSIASALAALTTVGSGVVHVLPGRDTFTFLLLIAPEVATQTITASTGTFTGGTTPAVTVSAVGRGPWSAFNEIGHTSQDNPLQVNRDGGDVTLLGSWQADGIESSREPITQSLAFSLLQYDNVNMKLYYGANATVGLDGGFQINSAGPTPTEAALFLVVRNGTKAQVRYFPRTQILSADGESFDTSKLAEMPVAASILQSNTINYGYSVGQVGVAA